VERPAPQTPPPVQSVDRFVGGILSGAWDLIRDHIVPSRPSDKTEGSDDR
jgi:hypothetical protein